MSGSASAITIRPFTQGTENMGLEKYNLVLFDNVYQEEPLMCLEKFGQRRYITGLNEYAEEVQALPAEQRKATVDRIRETVSQLEKLLAANEVDPADPLFWSKIKTVRPDNEALWSKIILRVSNDPIYLDPRDPYDLIKICAIEAQGFSLVARNLEDARTRTEPVKFYLDKFEDTAAIKTEYKKLRNKALAELQKLFDKNKPKLLYVTKVVDINSPQYKTATSSDVLYDAMDRYINGEADERNKARAAQTFLDVVSQDLETLKLRAMIKDATYYNIITARGDGNIYHLNSATSMGRNPTQAAEFLRNPLHDDILAQISKQVEYYWNN